MADEQGGGKKGFNPKVLIIGLPLFIIQLLAVYYVTANILLTKIVEQQGLVAKNVADSLDADLQEKKEPEGNHIYKVEELIVNPAGTAGQRILLVSLGIDVASEENIKVLEAKNLILKDMILTVLSSKTLQELSDIGSKDMLKNEIMTKINESMKGVKVNNIYFEKYVIN